MGLKRNTFVADFETTTIEEDCRVWAWAIYSINKDETKIGKDINSFFKQILKLPNGSTIYFHNLKFDGEFMLYHLFNNGFKYSNKKKLEKNEFNTLIDGLGNWYSLQLKDEYEYTYRFYDSFKIIPFGVKAMSKAFDIEQLKGDIDYTLPRPIGWELTENEREYITNDVEIVGKSLMYFFTQGLNKITQASNAFSDFKEILGKEKFKNFYPKLDIELDKQIRSSYKGGFTYVSPQYQDIELKDGIVLDVNSLYPSVMRDSYLPYGEPIQFDGNYKKDKLYNLYIISFRCSFELKKDHIPTVQIKNNMFFNSRLYLENSSDMIIPLTMTNVDFDLFKLHYNIYNIEIFGGWKFKSSNMIFKDYVKKWGEVKQQASIDNNPGLRTIAKLMLNSLYGKFGLNPQIESKVPHLNEKGLVKYTKIQQDDRDPVYIPVASFVTAYSRSITITAAQKNYQRFIYADTDSLHLVGLKIPSNIKIHSTKLGYWDHENTFTKGRFLRAKSYIEEIDNKTHVTCAGLPANCHVKVNFDNFRNGLSVPGKLRAKRVRGGIVLEETYFTIKM